MKKETIYLARLNDMPMITLQVVIQCIVVGFKI